MIWNNLEVPDNPYFVDEDSLIYCADCREILPGLPKVDLVLTDPPYGVTQNKGDVVVDLSPFLVYPAVVFSQQPYTTDLISQHRGLFKYDLVWDKVLTSGFLNANRMPLRQHEIILIFGDVKYTPIKKVGKKSHSVGKAKTHKQNNYGDCGRVDNADLLGEMKHPTSILEFTKPHPSKSLHRTEKPVDLIEFLIESYSEKGNIILDPFLGSGSILVACKELNRKCIGIEIEEKYCEIAVNRLRQSVMKLE